MKTQEGVQLVVIARAPFEVYYEGPARVVSAENQVGKFDILPGHADFFSIINAGEVVIATDEEDINIPVSNGIVCVRADQVMLFLNI